MAVFDLMMTFGVLLWGLLWHVNEFKNNQLLFFMN